MRCYCPLEGPSKESAAHDHCYCNTKGLLRMMYMLHSQFSVYMSSGAQTYLLPAILVPITCIMCKRDFSWRDEYFKGLSHCSLGIIGFIWTINPYSNFFMYNNLPKSKCQSVRNLVPINTVQNPGPAKWCSARILLAAYNLMVSVYMWIFRGRKSI